MTHLTIDWSDPLADDPAATGRGLGSLWVFAVVVDARTTRSRRFVQRVPSPAARSFEDVVEPVDGIATVGLLALWSRWHGPCGDWMLHGDLAARALDALVARRVPAANARDLHLGVEQDISDTVRRGWSGLGPLAEDHLAVAHRLLTLDGPVAEPVDLRLSRYGGDRLLHATVRYGRPALRLDRPAPAAATPVAAGAG